MPDVTVGGEREQGWEAICATHGTVGLASYERAREQAMIHFALRHPSDQMIVLEGKDFWMTPAALRCDLCGALTEPPGWDYKLDEPLHDLGDADGEWLVCDACHPLVVKKDVKGLIKRAVDVHAGRSAGEKLSPGTKLAIKAQFEAFLAHAGEGVRES